MAVLFASTLRFGPPLIERIARFNGMPISEHGLSYVRTLTGVWAGFFVLNGLIALWTALRASIDIWALYNGLLSYALIGALLLGEWVFRGWYKTRVGDTD